MKTETKTIAIDNIVEASWNTRSEITEASVRALAESIKADGLLQPLNVIADGEMFKCFDGCRRLNALKLLGAKDAPCRVWSITEDEARIKTITANIQREDDDPLLAAQVIGELLDAGMKPEQIATKLGKTTAWVNRRRKLIALAESARKLVGKITVDALERIATLPQKAQEKVVKAAECYANNHTMVTANDLRWDIQQQQRDLDNAVFDTENCKGCERRTGAQADLFGEADGKLGKCLDCKCFDQCLKKWIDAKIAELTQGATEIVRVQYSYQMPDYAKATKLSKKNPCAYVFVYGDDAEVKFGPSKKQMDAEKKAHEAELAESRKEKNAERERDDEIGDKFNEYFSADENYSDIYKAIKKCLEKPTKTQTAWIVELIADNWSEIWNGKDKAMILKTFPFTRELCGIKKDDAKWYCERHLEGCEE